ncbi:hypothetical protein F5Y07DRAFT_401263 [Xylaria sp. FL0933]|nr:hypothetical protein F5Y07DRAFT_401263 [Xylaria sp. FL0933]
MLVRAEHHRYQRDFPRSLECGKGYLAAGSGKADQASKPTCFDDEPPRTKNKPHRVTRPARRASKARQSHNYRTRQNSVLPTPMTLSHPECPIHGQTKPPRPPPNEHGDTGERPNSQAKKPRTHIFVHGGLQGRREMGRTHSVGHRMGGRNRLSYSKAEAKPGKEGWMQKHAGVTGERTEGEREPLCFYGGAFPRSRLRSFPERKGERGVRGLSPKAG